MPDCLEARLLLDAYVMALSNDDVAIHAVRSGDLTAKEARLVQDLLIQARNRYWRHVQRHRCRKRWSAVFPDGAER